MTSDRLRALAREVPKPQARKLRDRATMNILTVTDPVPEVVKPIVRHLLSALETAERYINAQRQDLLSRTDPPVSEGRTESQLDAAVNLLREWCEQDGWTDASINDHVNVCRDFIRKYDERLAAVSEGTPQDVSRTGMSQKIYRLTVPEEAAEYRRLQKITSQEPKP